MNLTKNDILVRYEELNGYDYKFRISEKIVAAYIVAYSGVSDQSAMAMALEMRDPELGWAMVMDQDERFYEWVKRVFKQDALDAFHNRRKEYVVFWGESEKLKQADFKRIKYAFDCYKEKTSKGFPCAVYVRNNGTLHCNPIRQKNKPYDLTDKVRALVNNGLDDKSECGRCRISRGVKSCKECCRYRDCRTRMEAKQWK